MVCVCVMWLVLCFLLNTDPLCPTGSEGRGWAIKGQEVKQMRWVLCVGFQPCAIQSRRVHTSFHYTRNSEGTVELHCWVLFTYVSISEEVLSGIDISMQFSRNSIEKQFIDNFYFRVMQLIKYPPKIKVLAWLHPINPECSGNSFSSSYSEVENRLVNEETGLASL